jgi:hypothetical protein
MRRSLLVLVTCLAPSFAFAGKPPVPGSQHSPPLFIDESTAIVSLTTHGSQGYVFRARAMISGTTSASDTVRLDWKQGGKLLASAKCGYVADAAQRLGEAVCSYEGAELHAKGAIDAELVLFDDKEEKDFLVRTFKVTVASWKEIGNTTLYQIVPDDLLGIAWAFHYWQPEASDDRRPQFRFWVAGDVKVGGALRCTVDGTKLDDIEATLDSVVGAEEITAEHTPPHGAQVTYSWKHVQISPRILFGKKENPTGGDTTGLRFLIDNPGSWECKVRTEGKTIRELVFTVTKDGMIAQDEIQTGTHAIATLPSTSLIRIRIPKDAGDSRVRPAAMKKSIGFGLAWPDHPSIKAIHAAFPPASGLPDPK